MKAIQIKHPSNKNKLAVNEIYCNAFANRKDWLCFYDSWKLEIKPNVGAEDLRNSKSVNVNVICISDTVIVLKSSKRTFPRNAFENQSIPVRRFQFGTRVLLSFYMGIRAVVSPFFLKKKISIVFPNPASQWNPERFFATQIYSITYVFSRAE